MGVQQEAQEMRNPAGRRRNTYRALLLSPDDSPERPGAAR